MVAFFSYRADALGDFRGREPKPLLEASAKVRGLLITEFDRGFFHTIASLQQDPCPLEPETRNEFEQALPMAVGYEPLEASHRISAASSQIPRRIPGFSK